MARTAHGSRASAPSPYTVSVGKATSPPRRISAAASSRSAGDLALSSRVSTSRNAVVRRLQSPGADAVPDGLLHCSLAREIEGRRHARDFAVHGLQVLAPAQVALAQATDDGDAIARGQEAAARILRAVVHQADHPDHRRREHRLAFGLVVERYVARHHWRL